MLADLPLVCGDGCPFWEATQRTLHEAGFTVTPKAIATRAEWLYELVSAGVGIGVAALHGEPPAGLVTPPDRGCRTCARHQPHDQARPALFAAGEGVRRPGAQAETEACRHDTHGGLSEPVDRADDLVWVRATRPVGIAEGIADHPVAPGHVGGWNWQLPARRPHRDPGDVQVEARRQPSDRAAVASSVISNLTPHISA